MNLDELPSAWGCQNWRINTENLAESMQRLDRSFSRTIFWRDAREIGVSLGLIPVWIGLGIGLSLPWTWYLAIPGLGWIAGFMLVDRVRQRWSEPAAGGSLRSGVEWTLSQVEHQIWLLRHVHWWYLLPLAAPMLAFVGQLAWETTPPVWFTALVTAIVVAVLAGAFGFVYWLNQSAVRKELEPLRGRLQSALAALTEDEAAAEAGTIT
jgi:hypothetical protein